MRGSIQQSRFLDFLVNGLRMQRLNTVEAVVNMITLEPGPNSVFVIVPHHTTEYIVRNQIVYWLIDRGCLDFKADFNRGTLTLPNTSQVRFFVNFGNDHDRLRGYNWQYFYMIE